MGRRSNRVTTRLVNFVEPEDEISDLSTSQLPVLAAASQHDGSSIDRVKSPESGLVHSESTNSDR